MAKAAQEMQPKKPACPECGTEVQSTWRWCLACGFDPDGLRDQHERRRPSEDDADASGAERRAGAGWTVVVVVVGVLLAGSLYYARTRASTVTPSAATTFEVTTTAISWSLYQSPEGGFSLFLPTPPTAETYDVPLGGAPRSFHNYTAMFGDDSYTVSYVDADAAEAAQPPPERLRAFATAYAAVIGGTPRQPTDVVVDGNPALDFSFDLKGAGLNRSRAIVHGSRTYVISVIGAHPAEEDFTRMITTFKLQ